MEITVTDSEKLADVPVPGMRVHAWIGTYPFLFTAANYRHANTLRNDFWSFRYRPIVNSAGSGRLTFLRVPMVRPPAIAGRVWPWLSEPFLTWFPARPIDSRSPPVYAGPRCPAFFSLPRGSLSLPAHRRPIFHVALPSSSVRAFPSLFVILI